MRALTLRCLAACFSLLASLTFIPAATAQSAGELVSATQVELSNGDLQAWRVAYWTLTGAGKPITVTGMVVAPRGISDRPRRVIAWAHGTTGVVERCAPSLYPDFAAITPALAEMIGRGYVVVAPDYPGLGTSMPHPNLVGPDTARSVLDAVRAARAIDGAAVGNRFAVWGESQGGHAALWTAMSAASYAPELTLVGTAAAAPPTDLAANLRKGSDPNLRAMLTAFATYSWSRHYGADLASLFDRFNRGVVTRLAENNCIELNAKPKLGTILGILSVRNKLGKTDITRTRPWSTIARDNSVDPRAVKGPLFIAQTVDDPIVSSEVTRAFVQKRCRAGLGLRFLSMPGGDHAHSARDSSAVTLDWIDARFAGLPVPDDCPNL